MPPLLAEYCINVQLQVAPLIENTSNCLSVGYKRHRLFWEYPGRGGQTEVTPDQTSFERTHVPGALELHGLEKASSALLSGQWSGTCLIRGHFVLGRSDQRSLWSGTVWSEAVSSAHKSDQRPIRAHTSLTRDQFERHFFQVDFVFLLTFVVSGRRQQ